MERFGLAGSATSCIKWFSDRDFVFKNNILNMLCKLLDVSSPHMYSCCIDVQRGHMGASKLSLREIDHGLMRGGNNRTIHTHSQSHRPCKKKIMYCWYNLRPIQECVGKHVGNATKSCVVSTHTKNNFTSTHLVSWWARCEWYEQLLSCTCQKKICTVPMKHAGRAIHSPSRTKSMLVFHERSPTREGTVWIGNSSCYSVNR
jgi:hypothetical protein